VKWAELTIETSPEAAEGIADALRAEGARGVAEERVDGSLRLTAYLPSDRRLRRRVERVSRRIRRLEELGLPTAPGTIGLRQLEAQAWSEAWKDHFQIIRLPPRLVIRPSWLDYQPAPGEAVVVLDPGMAFGTGSHPTTRLCLRQLCRYVQPGQRVIDVGTGSGILALAAAALGASRVLAIDEDDLALRAARANIRRNRFGRRITLRRGDLLRDHSAAADLVVANIVAEALVEMAPMLPACLSAGGVFIGSGLTPPRAPWVEDALLRAGLSPLAREEEDGWAAVIAKRSPA
jgi:ribosomal protein L11 methyltransferase